MKDLIIREYQETVSLAAVPDELKQSLGAHMRVPAFIMSLERELKRLPAHMRTPANIKATVHDLTILFLENLKHEAETRMISDAARDALKRTADRAKRYDEIATGDEPIDIDELMEVAPDGSET